MKALVTGAAGFLGYHLANFLAAKGCDVVLLDIVDFDKSEYPKAKFYAFTDIRDGPKIARIFKIEMPDIIVHTAAALPLWKREDILGTNINGTKTVLDAAESAGIKKVIFISSTAVYGIHKSPAYEEDALRNLGPYGLSKIMAEKLCEDKRTKLCVPIVRPATFIGTGRLGIFQIFYDWIKSGKRIPIIGDGKNRYQLLHVTDLCDAIYKIALAPENKVNSTFNVGAKDFSTVKEDVIRLCKYAGSGAKPISIPAFLAKPLLALFEKFKISPLYKWVYDTMDKDSFVSIEKIEKTLAWFPKYSNADALIESYRWYLDNINKISETGITHRVAWDQGVLRFFKKIL